jgi:hypothetical protein
MAHAIARAFREGGVRDIIVDGDRLNMTIVARKVWKAALDVLAEEAHESTGNSIFIYEVRREILGE